MTPVPTIESTQAALDAGRLQQALTDARAVCGNAEPVQRNDALRLRAQAAFRLGELDEAADAAQALIDQLGDHAACYPERTQVLAVSVVAAGELARFEQSLGHLQKMLAAASRGGSLEDYVRARGMAATCFALLGDAWAGQRLMSELLGLFQGLPGEAMLEASTRNNHTAICVRVARMAREGGDEAACAQAIEHAQASLQRSAELARLTGNARLSAFAALRANEVALLRGEAAAVAAQLQPAIEHADAAGLPAQVRLLRVVQAEAFNDVGAPDLALSSLGQVDAGLREGHQIGLRLRCVQQLQRACAATGAHAQALAHAERARQIEQGLLYRQLHAQSRFLRTRLELEHLYRYRASTSRGINSGPGKLTAPLPLEANTRSKR
jgi:hypothetical protein